VWVRRARRVYPTFPSSPALGDMFYASNAGNPFAWDGSAWVPRSVGVALNTWTNSGSYTGVNNTGLVLSSQGPDIKVTQGVSSGSGDELRHVVLAGLSVPYSYTVRLRALSYGATSPCATGVSIKSSSSGRISFFGAFGAGGGGISGTSLFTIGLSSETTPSIVQGGGATPFSPLALWLRITNTGTTRTYDISHDGVVFYTRLSESVATAWIDSANPEDITGVGAYTVGGSQSFCEYVVDSLLIQ